MTDGTLQIKTELLVDSSTLFDTIEALATTCYEKADHLRSNWQDEHTARQWEKAAKALDRIMNVAAIRAL